MPPDPEITADGTPGETLARFAVVLAAHRGQLAEHAAQLKHLADTVAALSEGGPKGPPMIAWPDLDADEAAAVRADLARWVDQVLFPLYPQRPGIGAGLLGQAPRRGYRAVRLLAGVPPDLRRRRPGQVRQASPAPPASRRHPGLPGPLAAGHAAPRQSHHRKVHRNRRSRPPTWMTCPDIPAGRLNAPGPRGPGAFKRPWCAREPGACWRQRAGGNRRARLSPRCFGQPGSASPANRLSAVIHEIAEAGDSCDQPFAFQHAQRLPAGGSCVSMLLAEASDRRRTVTRPERAVRDLLAQGGGQAHVGPWVRKVPLR